MRFDWWTLALQTINFAVLVWLLHRFLYKPVLRMIDTRRAEIEKQYAEASAAEASAKDELASIKAARTIIAAEHEAALKAAAAEAEEVAKARYARAEGEAAALLDGARKTLAVERGQALAEARESALGLGTDIARRLLAEAPVTVRADALLERIERYLRTLSKADMDALARQLGNGAALTVVTAPPLAPEAAETWRSHLRRSLGDGISVSFQTDPALLAGAELHFPSAILRFSWQSALETMRAKIEA